MQAESSGELKWLPTLCLVLLIFFALWIRIPYLEKAVYSDEIAFLNSFQMESIFDDNKTATHPPLLRKLFNPFEHSQTIYFARLTSLCASLIAIVLGWVWGKQLGRTWLAGLVMASALTFLPIANQNSAVYNSYAIVTMLLLWHGWALSRMVENNNYSLGLRTEVIVSTLMLPQFHYMAIPFLFLEACGLMLFMPIKRILLFYVPSAIACLPWLWIVFSFPDERLSPMQSNLVEALMGVMNLSFPDDSLGYSVFPLVVACTVKIFFSWSQFNNSFRLVGIGILAVLVTVFYVGSEHYLTYSVTTFSLGYILASLVVGFHVFRQRNLSIKKYTVGLIILFCINSSFHLYKSKYKISSQENLSNFSQTWREELPEDIKDIRIVPGYLTIAFRYYLTGTVGHDPVTFPVCSKAGDSIGYDRCLMVDGVKISGSDIHNLSVKRPILFFHNQDAPIQWPEGCEIQRDEAYNRVVICLR